MVDLLWCVMSRRRLQLFVLLAAAVLTPGADAAQSSYYGKYVGKLKTLHHAVAGEVYAVDARTLHVRDFSYDGEGPAAYFYAGDSKSPNGNGFRVNDEKGTPNVLARYRKKHITITLPDNKTLRDIKWFSVWCDEFSVNFGDVRIPKNLDYPKPQKIDALRGVHAVSSESIVVVDAQTLLVPSFSYDGEAPDAKFWVGRGTKPSPQGVRVPDENGKEVPLRRYDRKTIVLTLPGDLTVFDIGHFGVWCEAFTVDFGHVRLPRNLNVPPSLKMLGVSPQSKLNCEVLLEDRAFEVRWAVAGDSVVIQLVGKIDDGEYMSFGLSGDEERSRMIGGDVAVVWMNHTTLAGNATDYFLDAKSQCAGTRGSCPDERFRKGTNSIRLLNAAMVNGYSIVTYQRPLHASDELDRAILTNGSQPIIWAIGPLNSLKEVSYHHTANREDVLIDFARSPKWNCPIPEMDAASGESSVATTPATTTRARGRPTRPTQQKTEEVETALQPKPQPQRQTGTNSRRTNRPRATPAPAPKNNAWDIPAIQCYEPEDGVFYAQMGPTGGKRGYPAITGHVGWGISWYINGLLIPEINVVRGKTYSFVVEGGLDPETPARYHPFYITDDPVGGYAYKTLEERAEVQVLAGVSKDQTGEPFPTGTGRLCNWTPNPNQPSADEFASFGAYQRTLTLICDEGEAGIVTWTPDHNTPDTVYYQCYTHRYLGWRINVLDSCDSSSGASEPVPARVPGTKNAHDQSTEEEEEDGELQSRPSIRVTTRVKPNGVFYSGNKDTSQPEKDIVFKGFQKLPTNTQENFQQDFPFTLVDTTNSNKAQYEEANLGDVYIPPPALQKEPQQYSPTGAPYIPLSNQDQTSITINDAFTSQEPPTYLVPNYGEKSGNRNKGSIMLEPTSASPKESTSSVRYTQQQHKQQKQSEQQQQTASHSQHLEHSLSTIDPMRKPIIHATTPHSVLSVNTEQEDIKLLSSTPQPVQSIEVEKEKNSQEVISQAPEVAEEIAISNGTTESDVLNSNSEVTPTILNSPIVTMSRPMTHRPHGLAPHGYVMPSGRPTSIPTHPQMMFHRPQAYTLSPFRRPLPHRGYTHIHRPMHPGMFRHTYISTPIPQGYVMVPKKPYYRVTIMGPPHRTMVSSSPFHRPITTIRPNPSRASPLIIPVQQQYSSSYKNVQFAMAPQRLKYDKFQSISSAPTTTELPEMKHTEMQTAEILSDKTGAIISPAALLSSNEEPAELNMPVAVNTGFHPESVIVEGGFKPIVPKNIAAESRVSDESETVSKEDDMKSTQAMDRMDTETFDDIPVQYKIEEERKENPFEGQQPETFEPMFIPSPPDRIITQLNDSDIKAANRKSGSFPEDLIPPISNRNSAQSFRHPSPLLVMVRPALVPRPLYPNNILPPIRVATRGSSPAFRYQQSSEDIPDEMPMAAERMDTYYLPPTDYSSNDKLSIPPNVDETIPPGTVVTYDGKSVVDVSLASSISDPSASTSSGFQNPSGTADLIRATPQFGPFRGEVPPPVPNVVQPENIPQLQIQNQQSQTLPLQFSQQQQTPTSVHSTHLSFVQDDLLPAGSEIKELLITAKGTKIKNVGTWEKQIVKKTSGFQSENNKKASAEDFEYSETTVEALGPSATDTSVPEEQSTDAVTTSRAENRSERGLRIKRRAHHEPGHKGTGEEEGQSNHEHHHNHDESHDKPNSKQKSNSATNVFITFSVTLLSFVVSKVL